MLKWCILVRKDTLKLFLRSQTSSSHTNCQEMKLIIFTHQLTRTQTQHLHTPIAKKKKTPTSGFHTSVTICSNCRFSNINYQELRLRIFTHQLSKTRTQDLLKLTAKNSNSVFTHQLPRTHIQLQINFTTRTVITSL